MAEQLTMNELPLAMNIRAADLLFPDSNVHGAIFKKGCSACAVVQADDEPEPSYYYFDTDLNDAAKLWEAAPEEVKNVVTGRGFMLDHGNLNLWITNAILNPAALTEAVVKAWEGFNANR